MRAIPCMRELCCRGHSATSVSGRFSFRVARSSSADSTAEERLSAQTELESGVYVVSTPLGNLGDVTLRALSVLKSVSCIYAEDTRRTKKMLNAFDVATPLVSCHAHNEAQRGRQILKQITLGEAVAVVSDAGTPLISDPGAKLLTAVIRDGGRVIPVPGPSSVTAALVGSGLDVSSFLFLGFLPEKHSERIKRLELFDDVPAALILYVAPTDIASTLQSCVDVLGGWRRCCLAKELTKIHEVLPTDAPPIDTDASVQSFERATLQECLTRVDSSNEAPKGEITLIIEGATLRTEDVPDSVICSELRSRFAADDASLSEAVKVVSLRLGVRKRRVYKLALSMKNAAL